MTKRVLLVLATCVVLAGCASDQQSKPDANKAAIDETLAWLAVRQKDVPPPDPTERSPAAFLWRIAQRDTEGVRALCTEKGFRGAEHLGFDRIHDITSQAYPFLSSDEKDQSNAQFSFVKSGLGPTASCVVEMKKVGDEWHVDAVKDVSERANP